MASIDFTKKWDLSDVALKVKDKEDLLYANKTVLALHSPYFKTLFFSEFAESKQDVMDVDLSCWAMLKILRIIHNVDCRFRIIGSAPYSADKLVQLYQAADFYDIPLIRKLCKQQLTQMASKDALDISIQLDLHKEKSEILRRMPFEEIESYLENKTSDLALSAADSLLIVRRSQEIERTKPRCLCGCTAIVETTGQVSRMCVRCGADYKMP